MGEQCSPPWILGSELPTSRGAELLSLDLIYQIEGDSNI